MRLIATLLAVAITGCTTPKTTDVLSLSFGDERPADGITFTSGPWFAPASKLGFHYFEGTLRLAENSDSLEKYQVFIHNCPGLTQLVQDLRSAAVESAPIMTGNSKAPDPEVMVMDGDTHKLTIETWQAWGAITLIGGDTTSYIVPWVNAALTVFETGKKCAELTDDA